MRCSPRHALTATALAAALLLGAVPAVAAQPAESTPTPPPTEIAAGSDLQALATPATTQLSGPTASSTPADSLTLLTIDPLNPVRQGERTRVHAHLATQAGGPAVGQRIDLYVNGNRQNLGRTDDSGTASFGLPGILALGVHAIEARFDGSPGLLASSAVTTLEVVTPVATLLIVEPHQPLPLGERPTFEARLITTSGDPVVDEPIEVYRNDERLRRTRTDATGRASLRISQDYIPGEYSFSVVFPGSAPYLETAVSTQLVVEPALLEIHTVPALPGMQFFMNGRVFASDEQGVARIQLDESGTYHLRALPYDPGIPGVRPEFRRWDSYFTTLREVTIPKDTLLQVGYEVSHQTTLQFVDQDGRPVDPERIDSYSLKSSGGGVHTFYDSGPHWLPSARVIRTMLGIQQTELLYSLQDVIVRGSNVVNRAQQRFTVGLDDVWQVELLLFSFEMNTRDALFGFPVGKQIQLQYPDGSIERHTLGLDGGLKLESLPRGEYRARVEGVLGISPFVPVALSRNQVVSLKVISVLDLALGAVLGVTVALGLLFVGRPHLMHALRDLARRLRDLRPRLPDWAAWPGRGSRPEWGEPRPTLTAPDWLTSALRPVQRISQVLWSDPQSSHQPASVVEDTGVDWDEMWLPAASQLGGGSAAEGQDGNRSGPTRRDDKWNEAASRPPNWSDQASGDGRRLYSADRDGASARSTSREPMPVLAIADPGRAQQEIAEALADQAEYPLVQMLGSPERMAQELLAAEPEIVILDGSLQGNTAFDVIDDLTLQFPEIAVVAIANSDDPARLQQLSLAGARGIVSRPLSRDSLMGTLRRVKELELRRRPVALTKASRPPEFAGPLQVLAVYSPRGGTGVSTLAVNLAIALHEEAYDRVLLVDGKLAFGHVPVMLNLRSANSLADLLPHPNTGDRDLVEQVVLKHSSGVSVLPSPADLQVAQGIHPDGLIGVLHALRSLYDFIVVDAGSALTDNCLAMLEAADRYLLVCTPEMASLHDATQFIRHSRRLGFPTSKELIALNRAGMSGGVAVDSARELLQQDIFIQVPEDTAKVMRALNRGIPLLKHGRRSPVSKAIRGAAIALTRTQGVQPGRESGWTAAASARASHQTVSARAG